MDLNTEDAVFIRRQLIYKYLVIRQFDLKTHYSRLVFPSDMHNLPIQPGLFKGIYSVHALELVILTYEDVNKVQAVKITVRNIDYTN